jgi:hypothetical protein
MLVDIVKDAVAGESDLELVGTCAGCGSAGPAPSRPAPDVLLVGLTRSGELSARCAELLYAYPGAPCLAITHSGEGAYLYELQPHRARLGELPSPRALISIIRAAARRQLGAASGC